jgi:multiple sugar transport system ATP-binding protein
MASVTFDGVSKRYGDVTAVDHLDLAITDGEFMVLLGPSGCGKTTALRMIAGLEDISEGKLLLGDEIVNDVDPSKRDISMVFQSYALYPHMTVQRNIESPLLVRKYPVDGPDHPARKLTSAERSERVAEAARVLDLEPYLKRKPSALSGGQRQRVALARAFVGRPQAFLMDEPLSNLDAKLRAQTRIELVDLHRRVGTTIVYVTHDQVEAMTMATRVAVMAEGRLQQVGTPQDVYAKPANTFVAQFIGTPPMNCLPAVISADGNAVQVGGGTLPLPEGLQSRPTAGQPVTVGVRPEHLEVDPNGNLGVDVRAVEWLGHECLISASVGDSSLIVRQVGMSPDVAGASIRLSARPGDVALFDPDTTERLA